MTQRRSLLSPLLQQRWFVVLVLVLSSLLLGHNGVVVSAQEDLVTMEESVEDFTARMQDAFQLAFDGQNESFAMWVGLSDPHYGDLYFVLGNATGGPPPTDPAALDQRFDIGSISKTFGGTTIMLLAERGVLSLNNTVEELVPDFTEQFPEYANYTIEELLRMKTLVPDFLNDPEGLLNDYVLDLTKRYTVEEVVAYAMQQYPAELGTYSTTNYVVAQYIVETITNQSMIEWMQELVFDPLGLNHSMLPDRFSQGVHPEPSSTPYAGPSCHEEFNEFGFTDLQVYDDLTEMAQGIVMSGIGGAISSTIYDLLQWAKSGTGDSLLSQEMQDLRHVYDSNLFANEYGISQYIRSEVYYFIVDDSDFFRNWYGHDGDAFGYATYAYKNDVLNASFAAAVNTCSGSDVMDGPMRIFTNEIMAREGMGATTSPTNSMVPTFTGTSGGSSDGDTTMMDESSTATMTFAPTEASTETTSTAPVENDATTTTNPTALDETPEATTTPELTTTVAPTQASIETTTAAPTEEDASATTNPPAGETAPEATTTSEPTSSAFSYFSAVSSSIAVVAFLAGLLVPLGC